MNFFPLPKLHVETIDCNENNIHVRFLINNNVSTVLMYMYFAQGYFHVHIYNDIITHSKDEN